jgi:molybdate transport system substrate-binding protein
MTTTPMPEIPANRVDDLHLMEEKRAEGTTLFTRVHHRETPLRIALGNVDVGPVWATEIAGANRDGRPVGEVAVGPDLDQGSRVNYYVAKTTRSRNPDHAEAFIRFIRSDAAGDIYRSFGFVPHQD